MPKPVLSDSLFNAGDVATAVLAEANLQVTNNDLGVTDISSIVTPTTNTGWSSETIVFFNGFVFIAAVMTRSSTPTAGLVLANITNSDYHPVRATYYVTASYQGDSAERIKIDTNGEISVDNPINVGTTPWYALINGFYRTN